MNTEISPAEEERCWEAVARRDCASDGQFLYGVRSTGIYCRPSCPSRRPKREHVRFFASPSAAEDAGFRACRRCRPQEFAAQAQAMQRACRYLEAHSDEPLDMNTPAAQAGLSAQRFQSTFKRLVGISPRAYAETCRVRRFKECLQEGEAVTSAVFEAGYGSTSRLYERADAHLGMTPTAYRRGGQGQRMRYTIADCSLGRLLVAATDKGLCAVSLGDDDAALLNALRREFPAAEMNFDDADGLSEWVAAILDHLRGERPCLDLPLDVQATAFQHRVWQELQAIPYGQTRTYTEVARALGQPQAVRAVARACATNPTSLVVPCHRVLRADGSLAGYRWGVHRKQELLEQERRSKSDD